MTSSQPAVPKRRPGIMLVGPRLLDPTPDSAGKFSRWTRMHFCDLINMPTDPTLGKLTRGLRFVAPTSEPKYSHDETEGYSPYFYTTHVDDLGVLKTKAYYDVSRRLDLENTREIGEGEEAVGQEGMVFDIVDAKFAVFEEVEGAIPKNSKEIGSYQNLPLPVAPLQGKSIGQPASYLIGLSIKLSSTSSFVPPTVLGLQASLLQYLSQASSSPSSNENTLKIYTSLYRHAGVEAMPDQHPMIDCDASGDWLVTVLLVVGSDSQTVDRQHVNQWVEEWAQGVKDEKAVMNWGLWNGDMLLG